LANVFQLSCDIFKLRFEGEETGDILALPLGGNTCLGSTKAKQIITTSTVDTSGAGGDDSVSHLTTFALIYEGHLHPTSWPMVPRLKIRQL
jgi:hypothetical protein